MTDDVAEAIDQTTGSAFDEVAALPGPDLRALPRRERVRALMRQEILDAARKLVQEEGIKGLTMRALGRAVGVTAPTLYDYFPSKEAVLDAMFIQGTQLLSKAFDDAIASSPPGRERLRAIAINYRRFALDHPDLYFLLFARVDASYRPGELQIDCAHASGEKAVLAVAEAMALGEVRSDDPRAVGNALWMMTHGYITLELSGFCEKFDEGAGEQMYLQNFDILFNGLAPIETADRVPAE